MEENKDLSNWTSIEKENFKGVNANVKNWHIHITDELDSNEFMNCIYKIIKYSTTLFNYSWAGIMTKLVQKLIEEDLIIIELNNGKMQFKDVDKERLND